MHSATYAVYSVECINRGGYSVVVRVMACDAEQAMRMAQEHQGIVRVVRVLGAYALYGA